MAMVKYPFNGNLNPNEIFSAIFNMIISQEVATPELANNYSSVLNMAKTDGTLYGDTKLFYATDVLSSRAWLNDQEASNLLAVHRPTAYECQAITLDQFRQVDITVDQYLSKRAWGSSGVFSTFNSVILGMVAETKKLYEVTMFNAYVGTTEGGAARSTVEIPLSDITATGEEKNRLEAQIIAEAIANLVVDMKDYSRDFNDYGFMRAYNESDLVFIWNSKYISKITKLDLPTIFNNDGLTDKFSQDILPARYFGEVNTTGGTTSSTNTTIRSLVEKDYGNKHLFAGDLLPNSTAYLANETYTVDDDIICKVVTKNTYKYMSAFETATEFFNPRSLTTNHYLTWGFSKPDRLKDKPLVTIHAD